MASISYLQTRRGRYFFRRRYPRWLALQIGPGEIIKALPPCAYVDAIDLVRQLTTISDKALQMAMKVSDLTREDFVSIARAQFPKFQQKFEDAQETPDGGDPARWVVASQLRLSNQEWRTGLPAAKKVLSDQGYELDVDDADLKGFCRMLLRLLGDTSQIATLRLEGDYTARPLDPLFQDADKPSTTPSKIPSLSLSDAHMKFAADKQASKAWRPETAREVKNTIDLAVEWFDDISIDMITRQSVSDFREMLQHLPKLRGKTPIFSKKPLKQLVKITKADTSIERVSERTVSKHMGNLSNILDWSKRHGYATDNPALGVHKTTKRKRAANEERAAWTTEQLKRWFSSPIYTGCKSEGRRHEHGTLIIKDHQYWLPLLALYHPVRAEEIAQLFIDDILNKNGISYMKIDGGLDATEIDKTGKKIKNLAARRQIPIHRVLLENDFLDYVEETREAGHQRLFYMLKQSGTGERFSAYYCKRFSHYKKQYGIKDATFHSFRHNAITSLSENHPNTDINDELAGHAIPGQRGRYRHGASIEALKVAIDSISHNDIDRIIVKEK